MELTCNGDSYSTVLLVMFFVIGIFFLALACSFLDLFSTALRIYFVCHNNYYSHHILLVSATSRHLSSISRLMK